MQRVVGGLLLAAAAGAVILFAARGPALFHRAPAAGEQAPVRSVKTAEVEYSSAGIRLPIVGRVRANNSIEITSEVTGRVAEVKVSPTQSVKKGDLLIQLENNRQKALLREAEYVLKNYLRRLELASKLINRGAVSQDSYEQLQASVNSQRALVDARKAELDDRVIYAPFDGVVSLHNLTAGQLVKPGNVLLQLDDISRVYVDFPVPERFLSKIVIGQEVTAVTDAWPGHIFSGRVRQIDTHVDADTLDVGVRIYFENPELKLLDGMMLAVSLNLASEKLPVIPLKSLVYSGDDRYVFVVDDERRVFRRKVTLGAVNGAMAAITQGLRVGAEIVVEGTDGLRDGDAVAVIRQDDLEAADDRTPLLKKKDRKNTKDKML